MLLHVHTINTLVRYHEAPPIAWQSTSLSSKSAGWSFSRIPALSEPASVGSDFILMFRSGSLLPSHGILFLGGCIPPLDRPIFEPHGATLKSVTCILTGTAQSFQIFLASLSFGGVCLPHLHGRSRMTYLADPDPHGTGVVSAIPGTRSVNSCFKKTSI